MPSSLVSLLHEHKIDLEPDFSGNFIRNGSQWLKGRTLSLGTKQLQIVVFGDYARGISEKWVSSGDLSDAEKEEAKKVVEEAEKEARAEKERHWAQVQAEVEIEWHAAQDMGRSPYFEKKGLGHGLFGCRLELHPLGARTLVPARDVAGTLWGYQRIFSEKLDIGDKVFRKGSRKEGCFHLLGEIKPEGELYVCEGIATAISVHLATENPTLSVFDAGNLAPVAKAIRDTYPHLHIRFAADNDQYPAKDGKIYYTGFKKAQEAAKKIGNSSVILPFFATKDLIDKPTDWNDAHLLYGLPEIKSQLIKTIQEPPAQGPKESGPPTKTNPDEKPVAGIGEARLVKMLLDQYSDDQGPTLIRQGKDFFLYEKNHWRHLDPLMAPDFFKRLIDQKAGGKLKFKDIQSAYNRFFIHVAVVPKNVNLFAPNPFAQNFANGTVHLVPKSDGTFDLTLKPHRREDYLIHCHDFDFRENAEPNPDFEQALDRIWAGESDIEVKKNSYFEVLGACLIPAFRKLVLFVGPPKSGKSTLVLFAANMVHEDYRCSVDPTQFHGFNLQSMAGKLLNFDTDINLIKPITDSILKKVEDRCPMRIQRKGISDIYAPIPGMQLFAANRMPMSQEGGQAYDRRMLVFRCDKFQPTGDQYIQDYAQHVWRLNCQGVVARAIQGLRRLCATGGHFTIPDSSKAEIETWKKFQGDLVQDFLTDIEEGGFVDSNTKVMGDKEAKIIRKDLWEAFKVWVESSAPMARPPGKIKFYGRLQELGIESKTIHGVDYFCGFSVKVGPESVI